MTYEDQLGSIVARITEVNNRMKHIEQDHDDILNQLNVVQDMVARLQADIITFRAQTARPE